MSTTTTSESNPAPIRVAIVYVHFMRIFLSFNDPLCVLRGGGIAGLMFAIALTHSSDSKATSIHLYEAASKFTETGAGIGMFRRPWQVMKRLNLVEIVRGMTNVPDPEEDLRTCSS